MFVARHVVEHEDRVRRSHVVAVESPVARCPHQVVGRDDREAAVRVRADDGIALGAVIGEARHRGDEAREKRVAFVRRDAVALRLGDRREDQFRKPEEDVGVDVFKVGHPAARVESALVPEVASAEVGEVVLVVRGVVVYRRVLVEVKGVARIACRIPEGECRCRRIVRHVGEAGASRVKSQQFIGIFRKCRLGDLGVDFLGRRNQGIRVMIRLVHFPADGEEGKRRGVSSRKRSDSFCDGPRSASLGGALGVLVLGNVPELVVRGTDAYRMVHVAFVEKAVRLGRLVELVDEIHSDLRFPENVRDAVRRHRVVVGCPVIVLGAFRIDVVGEREDESRIPERFADLEVVAAIVPSAGKVMPERLSVLDVACAVKLGIGISAALDAEEPERRLEDRVVEIFVDDERKRSVLSDNHEIGSRAGELRKVGRVEVLRGARKRIRSAEFIDGADGIERAVHPDVRLCPAAERRKRTFPGRGSARSVDNLERGRARVGDKGELVIVRRAKSHLVYADGRPVIDVQAVEMAPAARVARKVDVRNAVVGEEYRGEDKKCPEIAEHGNSF